MITIKSNSAITLRQARCQENHAETSKTLCRWAAESDRLNYLNDRQGWLGAIMKQDDGLRTWLTQADELGELRTIEGADWDLEIGGVTDILTERGKSPAVLFDSIKGFPQGHRVLVNS